MMKENQNKEHLTTKWYHYLLAFLAGVFLMNTFPHFIKGVTGTSFPTPFANPPGKGLSSPALNVLWALINFTVGSSLFYFSKISRRSQWTWLVLMMGGVIMAFYLASYFAVYGK